MRRFDKLKNIKKANILAEQRYIGKLNESTEVDLINLITQEAGGFSKETGDFDNGKFKLVLLNDKLDIGAVEVDVTGTYKMISAGYFKRGRYFGPPEDTYPDEGENPEFDVFIDNIKISKYDEDGNPTPMMDLGGSDVAKMPKLFIEMIETEVIDMLLESDEFYSNDDGPDYEPDDY